MFTIMQTTKQSIVKALCLIASLPMLAATKQPVVFIDPIQDIYYGDQLFVLNKSLWGKAREKFARAGIKLTTDRRYLNSSLDCYIIFNAPVSLHAQVMMKFKKVKKILM